MAAQDQRVIATCGIISVAVGSANSIYKDGKMPSSRFLIGSGVAYLILAALSEGEPELAKGLAMGVLTTILLGEGGGVLSYISHGEIDTAKATPEDTTNDNLTPGRGAGPQADGSGSPFIGVTGTATANGQTQTPAPAPAPKGGPKPKPGPGNGKPKPHGGGGGGGPLGKSQTLIPPTPGPVQHGGAFSRDVVTGIPGLS